MSVPSVLGLRQKKGVWFWLGGRARSPSPYGGPFAAPEAARGPPCSMRGVSPRHSPQTLLGVMASFAMGHKMPYYALCAITPNAQKAVSCRLRPQGVFCRLTPTNTEDFCI